MKVVWSHSALKDYESCPKKYHEVRVLKKHKFTETQATMYGTELHKAAEDYIGEGKPLPKQFDFIADTLDALKAKPGRKLVEYQMALTTDLKPCGWVGPEVWVRGIADLLVVNEDQGFIVDYKTGSNKYPDPKQLQLMALMAFAHFPQLEHIKAGLLFVAHEHFVTSDYERPKIDSYWEDFTWSLERLHNSFETDTWQANPTPLCGWCPVNTCEYHKGR